MKKYLIKYYAILVMGLFIIDNIVLRNLRASGILYSGIIILISILNALLILKYRNNIKYKGLVIIIAFLILFFSKNIYHALFDISFMIILITVGISESNFIKILTILISLFVFIFHLQFMFAFLLIFGVEKGVDDIYQDMHYYCEDSYDVYAYSAGAMDKYHFSIGKHYEILNINGIIKVFYTKRNEKSQFEYEQFIKKHSCKLVGEKD